MRSRPKVSGGARLSVGQVTLERALSKLGIASRTVARQWIEAGRVRVNGDVRRHPLFAVHPEKARIEIDGEKVAAAVPRFFALHKPRGVITTRSDEKGRPTVFGLLPVEAGLHLHAVGRLDFATSGLLILTNDTRLSSWLTDPLNEVPRVYLVSVRGLVTEETIAQMERGVDAMPAFGEPGARERLQADRAILHKASGRESHLRIELKQGKNREIRRLLLALGHEVTRLKRISFGGLELGDLPLGDHREISETEIVSIFPKFPQKAPKS